MSDKTETSQDDPDSDFGVDAPQDTDGDDSIWAERYGDGDA